MHNYFLRAFPASGFHYINNIILFINKLLISQSHRIILLLLRHPA